MDKIKSILALNNRKTFFEALVFYFFHLLFSFAVSFVFAFVFFIFPLENSFSEKNVEFLTKMVTTVYLVILLIFLVKKKNSKSKLKYYNLALLGVILTYISLPVFGFIFPAYITTLGKEDTGTHTTLL